METLERIIAEHPFFKELEPHFLQLVAGCASNTRFNAGEMIFREGEEANHFYLIREGRMALEMFLPERGPIVVDTVEEGDVVGWSWLVPPYRWHFDGRALEVVRAIVMDGACLRRKCEQNPDLGYEMMKRCTYLIVQRLQATRRHLVDTCGGHR